jgi:predicted nucleic acid-binding protein
MKILVDTNILLRATQPHNPTSQVAIQAVKNLLAASEDVCVFNQSLIEFWNAATRDISINGLGVSPVQADAELKRIESMLIILPDHPDIYAEWRKLVVIHSVSGKQVHDTRIAAAMKVFGISQILTFNAKDFKRFQNISIIDPASL